MGNPIYSISEGRYADTFPDPSLALAEPNGLLAVGGDLSTARLREAYRHGLFAWYLEGLPILWWSPEPRTVLFPENVIIPRSLLRPLRRGQYQLTIDANFATVVQSCATVPRKPAGAWLTDDLIARVRRNPAFAWMTEDMIECVCQRRAGTWLTGDVVDAFYKLHAEGYAHSVECWCDSVLVGGLFGVAIGRVFFAESMFRHKYDASKACLVHLAQLLLRWGYRVMDCQVHSDYLTRMGAVPLPRKQFLCDLERWCAEEPSVDAWR